MDFRERLFKLFKNHKVYELNDWGYYFLILETQVNYTQHTRHVDPTLL